MNRSIRIADSDSRSVCLLGTQAPESDFFVAVVLTPFRESPARHPGHGVFEAAVAGSGVTKRSERERNLHLLRHRRSSMTFLVRNIAGSAANGKHIPRSASIATSWISSVIGVGNRRSRRGMFRPTRFAGALYPSPNRIRLRRPLRQFALRQSFLPAYQPGIRAAKRRRRDRDGPALGERVAKSRARRVPSVAKSSLPARRAGMTVGFPRER